MLRGVLDLLFPMRCASCGAGPWPFCASCRGRLVVVSDPLCDRCGRPTLEPVPTCRDCPPQPVERARAPFVYEGPARGALHRLKFAGLRAAAGALAAAMAAAWGEPIPDAVTWVPLSAARRAARGFDQGRALALEVGRAMGIRAMRTLIRVRDTPPQARRSGPERRRAMRGAFRISGRAPPSSLLLVDDVLTTGATAAECARVLRAAGASRVDLLTAARALSEPIPARCYSADDSRLSLWLPGGRPR